MAHIEAPGAGALVAASPAASPTHSTTPAQAISPSPGAPSINPTGNPVATHLTAGLVTPSLPTAAQVVTSLPHLPVSPGSMVDGVLTAGSINTVAGHVQPTSASAVSGGVSGTEANGSANSMTVLTVGEGDEMRVLTIQATAVQSETLLMASPSPASLASPTDLPSGSPIDVPIALSDVFTATRMGNMDDTSGSPDPSGMAVGPSEGVNRGHTGSESAFTEPNIFNPDNRLFPLGITAVAIGGLFVLALSTFFFLRFTGCTKNRSRFNRRQPIPSFVDIEGKSSGVNGGALYPELDQSRQHSTARPPLRPHRRQSSFDGTAGADSYLYGTTEGVHHKPYIGTGASVGANGPVGITSTDVTRGQPAPDTLQIQRQANLINPFIGSTEALVFFPQAPGVNRALHVANPTPTPPFTPPLSRGQGKSQSRNEGYTTGQAKAYGDSMTGPVNYLGSPIPSFRTARLSGSTSSSSSSASSPFEDPAESGARYSKVYRSRASYHASANVNSNANYDSDIITFIPSPQIPLHPPNPSFTRSTDDSNRLSSASGMSSTSSLSNYSFVTRAAVPITVPSLTRGPSMTASARIVDAGTTTSPLVARPSPQRKTSANQIETVHSHHSDQGVLDGTSSSQESASASASAIPSLPKLPWLTLADGRLSRDGACGPDVPRGVSGSASRRASDARSSGYEICPKAQVEAENRAMALNAAAQKDGQVGFVPSGLGRQLSISSMSSAGTGFTEGSRNGRGPGYVKGGYL